MVGIIIAMVLVAGGAFGAAKHDGVLKKGSDTTYRDTVEFEKLRAQETLAKVRKIEAEHGWQAGDDGSSQPESAPQEGKEPGAI